MRVRTDAHEPDGMMITRVAFDNVVTECGPVTLSAPVVVPIFNHAVTYIGVPLSVTGSFNAPQQASGTLRYQTVGFPMCTSSDIPWIASTSTPPPAACDDGADNDGDGIADYPFDRGCSGPMDPDEADEAAPPPGTGPGGLPQSGPPESGLPAPLPTAFATFARRSEGIGYLVSKGARVGLACPAACTATSVLRVGTHGAVLGKATKRLAAGGETIFFVKPTAKGKRTLRRAKRLALTLRTVVGGKTLTRRMTATKRAPANHDPAFPSSGHQRETSFEYDLAGRLFGGTTSFLLARAKDPDGDPLAYSWTASPGDIVGSGPSAAWDRIMDMGRFAAGTVIATASDGHGGKATYEFEFQRGAS